MAPLSSILLPRVDGGASTSQSSGLSTTGIIGIAVVSVVAVALAITLAIIYIRRRRNRETDTEAGDEKAARRVELQPSIDKEPLPADLQALRPPGTGASLGRSVSRRNLTPSIILPSPVPPVPPVPAARPRPPKLLSPTTPSARMSSAEILAHHAAAGTTPRAFTPGPFSFALNASPTRPSFDRGSYHTAKSSRTGSVVSFSRSSILSAARSSISTFTQGHAQGQGDLHKVRQVFTPLLPDELLLRPGEKVTLIHAYDDGWCVVGRKSPFAAPAPNPTSYAFGQGKARAGGEELEVGAVPAWAFEKRKGEAERPMRSTSLGVTLVLDEGAGAGREDVISWSNF